MWESITTVSTCPVNGNISTPHASFASYPFLLNPARSLARVSGPQETYTTRAGFQVATAFTNSSVLPLRGGTMNTTSAFPPWEAIWTMNFPASLQ